MSTYVLEVTTTDTNTVTDAVNRDPNEAGRGFVSFKFNRKDTARNAVKRVRRLQKNREGLQINYSLETL